VLEHGEERVTFVEEFSIIRCMTIKRMSHAVYDTRYHIVWAPKYRKWILFKLIFAKKKQKESKKRSCSLIQKQAYRISNSRRTLGFAPIGVMEYWPALARLA